MHRLLRSAPAVLLLGLGIAGVLARPASAAIVNFSPFKDNTIFSDLTGNSNGAGDGIYAGQTSISGLRRGLMYFDLQSIPADATILAATLTLNMTQTNSLAHTVALHRLTANWGEGTSTGSGQGAPATVGDATWLQRIVGTAAWTTAGGDFVGTASASQSVAGVGAYVWSGAGLESDVAAWVANPSSNLGWIVIGDETTLQTAKKFSSREGPSPPILRVSYAPRTPVASPAGLGLLGLAMAAIASRLASRRRAV